MLYNMLEQTLDVCGWRASWIFYDGGPYYRNQSTDLQEKSMDLFLYEEKLRHERVNALLLASIHWDIFLDYNKIIDIYASKYHRRMLLINPLSKN